LSPSPVATADDDVIAGRHILRAGLSPTFMVGGEAADLGSNAPGTATIS
jgi:hypothetical protein